MAAPLVRSPGICFGAIRASLYLASTPTLRPGIDFGGVNLGQVAAEGEYFYGRFTLQGILGIEFGNSVSSTQGIMSTVAPGGGGVPGVNTFTTFTQGYDIGTRFFDQINLKYYLGDNINAYVGHRYLGGKNAAAFGGEFAIPVSRGVLGSAFVEARVGESDFHGIWGGLKFYFGPTDKPLIARHRQEDPNNWSVDSLFSILNNHTSSGGSSTQHSVTPAILSRAASASHRNRNQEPERLSRRQPARCRRLNPSSQLPLVKVLVHLSYWQASFNWRSRGLMALLSFLKVLSSSLANSWLLRHEMRFGPSAESLRSFREH